LPIAFLLPSRTMKEWWSLAELVTGSAEDSVEVVG
jgi:hypothetical protein